MEAMLVYVIGGKSDRDILGSLALEVCLCVGCLPRQVSVGTPRLLPVLYREYLDPRRGSSNSLVLRRRCRSQVSGLESTRHAVADDFSVVACTCMTNGALAAAGIHSLSLGILDGLELDFDWDPGAR